MRETVHTEEKQFPDLDLPEFAPITVRENVAVESVATGPETVVLDSYVAAIKWIFLFLPGAAVIHFTLMALSLFFLYEPATPELILGTIGVFIVGTFMVMFGLGRFSDLRFLRVVAGLTAAAAIASILYSISVVFIPGDFFGWFTLITLPLTIIIGQLIKFKTDRDTLAE